jgi:membrane protein
MIARLRTGFQAFRDRHPRFDHVLSTQEHYGESKGSHHAGGITYFGFLSVFPILAIAVFVVGYLTQVFPDAEESLAKAINSAMPDMIGEDPDQISLDDLRTFSGLAGLIGLVTVLYTGLGWISALRFALLAMFDIPEGKHPSFVIGKLRDLAVLVTLGVVLVLAVPASATLGAFAEDVAAWLSADVDLTRVVEVGTVLIGLAANAFLLLLMFRMLAAPALRLSSLWSGALLGALGIEVLKQISRRLIELTEQSPAFQTFGIALILLVWINYMSRVTMYAAAWAYTQPSEVTAREDAAAARRAAEDAEIAEQAEEIAEELSADRRWVGPFAAGAGVALATTAVLRRLSGDREDDA